MLKIWRLKDETVWQEFVKAPEEDFQSGNVERAELHNNITQVYKDLCGVTFGSRGRVRDTC